MMRVSASKQAYTAVQLRTPAGKSLWEECKCEAGPPGYPEQGNLPHSEVTSAMKLRILVFALAVLAMGGTLVSLNGCGSGGSTTPPPPPPGKIQHGVVIFQENRTPGK